MHCSTAIFHLSYLAIPLQKWRLNKRLIMFIGSI